MVVDAQIIEERRPAKSDTNLRDEEDVLVGYDDTQGSLLARIYFPPTRLYELHENEYVRYQDIQHMVRDRLSVVGRTASGEACRLLSTVGW